MYVSSRMPCLAADSTAYLDTYFAGICSGKAGCGTNAWSVRGLATYLLCRPPTLHGWLAMYLHSACWASVARWLFSRDGSAASASPALASVWRREARE